MIKIICDNKEEYDSIVKACKCIHDFTVYVRGASKKTKIEVIEEDGSKENKPEREILKPRKGTRYVIFGLDFEKYSFLNFLAHISYGCNEKTRNEFLEIKEKK